MAGKLISPAGINAIQPGPLVFIEDQLSGDRFLADTGAAYSIIPGPASVAGPAASSVNGTPIATGGERRRTISLKDARGHLHSFTFNFLVAEIETPILGNDFFRRFNFELSPATASIRFGNGIRFPGSLSLSLSHPIMATVPSDIQPLLCTFSDVCSLSKAMPPPAVGVEHFLTTTGPPVTARFRRLDQDKLKAAKEIFSSWERDGVVQRSSSQWSSPLHMVRKKDGGWRPCGDFRRLNLITKPDKYPVPNLADFSHHLEDCTIFSKLDLRNGYLQVPLDKAAVPKTAVITPFGLWEFLRMPFGLKNAGMTFQRYMDQVFNGLGFTFIYIDDVLVASKSRKEHVLHLQEVLSRLKKAGLVLNVAKCTFAQSSVEFLGHSVSAHGIRPLADKVRALRSHSRPSTIKELQQFLGMLNFYRKFIPAAAQLLAPLTEVLKGSPAGSRRLMWTAVMVAAFDKAKSVLSDSAELAHPAANAELVLVTDASATHVGAALQQRRGGSSSWQPLGFFSHKLDKAQVAYSAFDRELLAAHSSIRFFRCQLEGRDFQLWTDHKPLTFALSRISDAWTPRQQRQLGHIAEYTSDIRYVPGSENVVADTLSRPPSSDTGFESTAALDMPPAANMTAGLFVPPAASRTAAHYVPPAANRPAALNMPPAASRPAALFTPPAASRTAAHYMPPAANRPAALYVPPAASRTAAQYVPPAASRPAALNMPPAASRPAALYMPPAASRTAAHHVPLAASKLEGAAIAVVAQPSPPFLSTNVDLASLAASQLACPEVATLSKRPSLKIAQAEFGGHVLVCDFSTGQPRPLLPPAFRAVAFAATHGLAHPGIRATKRLLSARWVWTGMASDSANWCRSCQFCQRAKVTRQPRAAVQQIPIPARRFSHLHVDLVGPLPRSPEGYSNLLTIVDRSSRWLEALPLLSTTAEAVADAFIAGWIARFGVPDHITSDRGPQFCSSIWSILSRRLGYTHHFTTAYHPQANGMVERAHRQLKEALKARNAGAAWPSHLPWVLLGLRAAPKEDSNISSAEILYGAPLVLPGQLSGIPEAPAEVFHTRVRAAPPFINARPLPALEPKEAIPDSLQNASFVYVLRGGANPPLKSAYSGPFSVVERNPKFFILDYGDRLESVSVDRLKPHAGTSIFTPASAPRRGRPPKISVAPQQSPPGGE